MTSFAPHEYRAEIEQMGSSEPNSTWDSSPLKIHTPEAREAWRASVEFRQNLERQDVLTLRRRGLVPLAIADHVGISLSRTVRFLKEAGEEIPGYLITSDAPKREVQACPHCGKAL